MTATDELRQLLDEHGIEWNYGPAGACGTAFRVNGHELSFVEMRGGVTCSTIFTPKQVVMGVREIVREKKYLQSELSRYESWFHWTNLAKKQLEVENAKLRESLENAAGIIADLCGECPVSRYEWLSSDGCAEKCGTVTEEECWIAYLTGKRWDESGVEADG